MENKHPEHFWSAYNSLPENKEQKYLLGLGNNKKNIWGHNNSSGPFYRAIKSNFSVYFSIESGNPNIFFALYTLSTNKFIK